MEASGHEASNADPDFLNRFETSTPTVVTPSLCFRPTPFSRGLF